MRLSARRAGFDDVPRLVEMAEAFVASLEAPAVDFDADGFSERLQQFLKHPDALILVLDDGIEAVGTLGAFAAPHFLFLRPRMAAEMWWWLEPEYRGGTAALRLLEAYEQWAEAQGAGVVTCSAFTADPRLQRLLERRGYVLSEQAFSKRLGGGRASLEAPAREAGAGVMRVY